MKKILALFLVSFLVACGPSEEEIRAKIAAEEKVAQEQKAKITRDAIKEQIEAAKKACNVLGDICRYSNTDNYHKWIIDASSGNINVFVNRVIFSSFKFPPQVLSRLEATSAARGFQETSMDGAKLSWDMSVSSGMMSTYTTFTFNLDLL